MKSTRAILLVFAFVGCSDYEIADDDVAAQDDDFNCEDMELPPVADVAINTECEDGDLQRSVVPVEEWAWGDFPFCGPPAVAQTIDTNESGEVDADDIPIVFVYEYQSMAVVALYGDGSGVAWQSAGGYGQNGGFSVGDIDGDGWPDVVTASETRVCALDGRTGQEHWCNSSVVGSLDPFGASFPAIADMEADSTVEVIIGDYILTGANGNIVAVGGLGTGTAPYFDLVGGYGTMSVPVDLDDDGTLELVTGNTVYDHEGNVEWHNADEDDGFVAVADFDHDGQGEIVRSHGINVSGLETDGTLVWGPLDFSLGSYVAIGAPAIDDLDGDGDPEIVIAAGSELIAIEWGGSTLWSTPIADSTGAAGPTLFDFDRDGHPEVLYADEVAIRVLSGLDGTVKFETEDHQSSTILENPIVADVDADGQVEILLGHCDGSPSSITVYGDEKGTWPPGRRIWNQHAYYITHVDDRGSIPTPTEPNYDSFNSFRSGGPGTSSDGFHDLLPEILEVCEDECDEGIIHVSTRLRNAGNLEVPPPVPVSLVAGNEGSIIATEHTTEVIPSGATGEVIILVVDADTLEGSLPVVVADSDESGGGVVAECDEDNNIVEWPFSVCD